MLVMSGMLVIIGMLLILPVWINVRSGGVGYAVFATPVFAVTSWFALVVQGYGAQSLANLVELPLVLAFSVFAAYVALWVGVKKLTWRDRSVYIAFVVVILFVVTVRTLMPVIPE